MRTRENAVSHSEVLSGFLGRRKRRRVNRSGPPLFPFFADSAIYPATAGL